MKYTISSLIFVTLLAGAMPAKAATLSAGTLVRSADAAVYYVTPTGGRLAFPNEATYFTWYKDFSTVKTVSSVQLASYPLTGNVTFRPGVKLLKLPSATTVYAVAKNGVLRPFANGSVAEQLYGANWYKLVNDLPEAFFVNYSVGAPIETVADYSPADQIAASGSLNSNYPNLSMASGLQAASVGPTSASGRIMSVAIDPANENIAYVGTASGGIFKTTNRGGLWSPVADKLNSMHVAALAIDPSNSSIVYAGTGETYTQGDDYGYMGVYVSRNGGASWSVLDSTVGLPFNAISTITVDPHNSSHLYLAGNVGVYESKDSGANWNKIVDGFIQNFLVSSANPNILFATGANTTVLRSTNAGGTWEKLAGWNIHRGFPADNTWFNRVTITQSSGKTWSNTKHVLYAALSEPFMLFRSNDEGDSWQELAKEPYESMRNYAVLADPTNADTVYTAGNTLHRATDGGWTVVSSPLKTYDVRAIAYAPSNSRIIYAATDNGVEVSIDNGITWNVKSDGLNTTQWYSAAIARDGSAVYGAVQDHSVLRLNASGSWSEMIWGQARLIVADPSYDRTVYAVAADSKGVGRSIDGGQTFSSINGNLASGLPIKALAVDPTAGGAIYIASGANLYGTTDAGANWYLFGSNNNASPITSITVGSAPHLIYVGRANGVVQSVDAFGYNASRPVWSNVYSEPNQKPVVKMAAYGNGLLIGFNVDWGTRIVNASLRGNVWTGADATGNLPEGAWVRSLAIDPMNPNVAFVGHLTGAFRGTSTDGRNWNWQRVEDGLPSVEVTDIAVSAKSSSAYLATWGRGLYQISK